MFMIQPFYIANLTFGYSVTKACFLQFSVSMYGLIVVVVTENLFRGLFFECRRHRSNYIAIISGTKLFNLPIKNMSENICLLKISYTYNCVAVYHNN